MLSSVVSRHFWGMTQYVAVVQYIIPQLLINSPFAAAVKEAGYICAEEFKNWRYFEVRMQTFVVK